MSDVRSKTSAETLRATRLTDIAFPGDRQRGPMQRVVLNATGRLQMPWEGIKLAPSIQLLDGAIGSRPEMHSSRGVFILSHMHSKGKGGIEIEENPPIRPPRDDPSTVKTGTLPLAPPELAATRGISLHPARKVDFLIPPGMSSNLSRPRTNNGGGVEFHFIREIGIGISSHWA